MTTFSDSFGGAAVGTSWKQYGGNWTTAAGVAVSASNGATAWRLTYDLGDQKNTGDVMSAKIVFGAGAGFSGMKCCWQGDVNGTIYSGYVAGHDVASGHVLLRRYDAGAVGREEDTGVAAVDGATYVVRRTDLGGGNYKLQAVMNGVARGTGWTNENTYTSGGVGIFDLNGDSFDDAAVETDATLTVSTPAFRVTHYDGSTTDYPSQCDSDRARGKALLDAQAAYAAGDIIDDISTARSWDVGGAGLAMPAGTVDATDLKLGKVRGAGKHASVLYGQPLTFGALITGNDNQEYTGFRVHCNTGQINGSPFGHRGTVPAVAAGSYARVRFRDLFGIGPVDCFHTTGGPLRVANCLLSRCTLRSSFDTCIVVNNSCADGSTVDLQGCDADAIFPHPDDTPAAVNPGAGLTTRAISVQDASCVMTVHGSRGRAGGATAGSPVNAGALVTLGTLNLYNSTVAAISGTNAADLQQSGGVLNVGADVVYTTTNFTGGTRTLGIAATAYIPAMPVDCQAFRLGNLGTAAVVRWTRDSVNETSFTVEWSTTPDFSGTVVTQTVAAGAQLAVAAGLTAGTQYYFRVKAVNGAGSSGYSNTARGAPARRGRGERFPRWEREPGTGAGFGRSRHGRGMVGAA